MAGYYNHNAGTTYKCIDSDPKSLQGGHTDNNGYLFLFVEGRCGSLKCPPYAEGRRGWRLKRYAVCFLQKKNNCQNEMFSLMFHNQNDNAFVLWMNVTWSCSI